MGVTVWGTNENAGCSKWSDAPHNGIFRNSVTGTPAAGAVFS